MDLGVILQGEIYYWSHWEAKELIDEVFPFCRLPCLYDTAAELASYVLQGELSLSF